MAHRDRVRIAAAQYPIGRPRAMDEWRDHAARWVADGAATGADLLVFPEYGAIESAATLGPEVAGDLPRTLGAVADLMPQMAAVYADLARAHGLHILMPSGPVRHADGRFVNAARLVTPEGRIGIQEKLIMTPFERAWGVAGGGPLRVFATALGGIAIAVCYDSEFPLLVRAQAEAGAELLLIPSCTERISGYHRVRTAALARALENTLAAVISPTVGEAPWSPAVDRNVGAAGIYVPAEHGLSDTGVLAEGALNAPGWVAADIPCMRLRQLKTDGEMRNATDWALQPGASALASDIEVVALT